MLGGFPFFWKLSRPVSQTSVKVISCTSVVWHAQLSIREQTKRYLFWKQQQQKHHAKKPLWVEGQKKRGKMTFTKAFEVITSEFRLHVNCCHCSQVAWRADTCRYAALMYFGLLGARPKIGGKHEYNYYIKSQI